MNELSKLLTVEVLPLDIPDTSLVQYFTDIRVLNVSLGMNHATRHSLTISDVTLDISADRHLHNIEVLWPKESWKEQNHPSIPSRPESARVSFMNVEGHLVEDHDLELLTSPLRDALLIKFLPEEPRKYICVASKVVLGVTTLNVLTSIWIEGIKEAQSKDA